MNFSIKKLLSKKDNQQQKMNLKGEQNVTSITDTPVQKETPKKKHGEPGVCCGSCS